MSLSNNSRNNATSVVRLTKIGTLFLLLAILLSLAGGPAAGSAFAQTIAASPAAPAATISYMGNIGSGSIESTSATTMAITPSAAVAAGDAIIITVASDPLQTFEISATDTQNNTYYPVVSSVSMGNVRVHILVAYNVTALTTSDTITINHSALTANSGAFNAVVSVFRGLASAGAFDQNHVGNATTTTTPTSGSITTTQADELLIGAIGTEGWVGDTAGSWGSTWTNAETRLGTGTSTGDTHVTLAMNYQIVSATGTYEASKTGITSRDAASAIVAFKTSCAGICYIGDIGYAQSSTAGTTLTVTTKADVAVGDDIVVNFAMDGATGTVSAADSTSNTYNAVANAQFTTPSASNVRTAILDTHVTTALPKGSTITVSHPSVTARSAVVSVFRGLAASPSVDQTKTSTGTGTAPTSTATSSTSQADELLFGAVGTEGYNADVAGVWDNAFNQADRRGTTTSGATGVTTASGWKIVSSVGTYTASITGITSADWAAAIATFKKWAGPTHNLSVSVDPVGGGTTSPSGTTNTYAEGAVVNVTASANLGYAFASWTGACIGTDPGTCSVTMSTDKSVTAHFTTVPTYVLTTAVSPPGGGTINPSAGVHTYNQGTVFAVTATPSSGYAFSSWSGACTGSGACSVTMDAAKSVTANFAATTTFTGTELLGRPKATSIAVSVVPNAAITLYYEYGTTTGVYTAQTTQTTAAAATPKVAVISGLTPNTKYYYRMRYSTDSGATWVARPEFSFQTQRATGSTFKFTITTDSHVNILLGSDTTWQNTLNDIKDDGADFEIDLGDTFAMDNGSTSVALGDTAAAEQKYKDQLPYFNTISGSSPIYVVPGNHEQQEAWHLQGTLANSLPVMGKNAEKKYFLNPVNDSFYSGDTGTYSYLSGDQLKQDYFAWTWGDALFVVISPFWTTTTKPYTTSTGGGETDATGSDNRWDWTLGQTQFNWLKTTLQNSTAKYKFVFAHQIVGGNRRVQSSELWAWRRGFC